MSSFFSVKTIRSPGFLSISAILALWLISIGVRAPGLDDPLGRKFEILTAHTLITLDIWQEKNPAAYHFSPVYTFDSNADRHIQSLTSGMADKQGNYYYVSYPPFAFIFPFYIFKALSITPSVFALRVLNLLLHLVCALGLYYLVLAIHGNKTSEGISMPALGASSVYLFSPGTLWYHSNVYFVDVLVQPLWILGILITFKILQKQGNSKTKSFFLLGLVIFLTAYTEWLGFFFAGVISLIALFRFRSDRFLGWLLLVVLTSCVIALSLTIYQYASINDLDTFLESSTSRYIQRSGYNGRLGWFFEWRGHYMVFMSYLRMHFPTLSLLVFLLLAYIVGRKKEELDSIRQNQRLAIILSTAPVLIHHFVFFDFTVIHEFSTLKSSVPIAIFTGILLHNNLKSQDAKGYVFFRRLSAAIIFICLTHSTYTYYKTYIPISRFIQYEFATTVNATAQDNEVIFLQSKSSVLNFVYKTYNDVAVDAQFQYYTQRNIEVCKSKEEALRILSDNNQTKGIIYKLTSGGDLISFEKISHNENGQ